MKCYKISGTTLVLLMTIVLAVFPMVSFGQGGEYAFIQSEFMFFEPDDPYSLSYSCYNCESEKYLSGIRVDSSIQRPQGRVYFFNREIIEKGYVECITIGPSIIGDSMVEQIDGFTKCFNLKGEEILFNRLQKSGEESLTYTYENGDYISATVVSHVPEAIQNITDSVKTYAIQRYDEGDNPLEDPVNDFVFKLSKTYGLIRNCNFRDFPAIESWFPNHNLISSSILGPEELLLTYGDMYDFEIGDEFHYRREDTSKGPNNSEKAVRTVLEKSFGLSPDTVSYTFQEIIWGSQLEWINGELTSTGYHYDTIYTKRYTGLSRYIVDSEAMPLEALFSFEDLVFNNLMFKSQDHYNNRWVIRSPGMKFTVSDCIPPLFDSYSGSYYYYILGCGHLYSSIISEIQEECYPCESLVYYRKGAEIWGTPFVIPGIRTESTSIKLYPNPANAMLVIEFENELFQETEVEIFDGLGKLMQRMVRLKTNRIELDVHDYPKGLYFCRLTNLKSSQTSHRKFLIE